MAYAKRDEFDGDVRRWRRMLIDGRDLRLEKAQHIRRSIDGRTYENDLKLEIAIDRMLDELTDDDHGGGDGDR